MAGSLNVNHLVRNIDLFTLQLFIAAVEERQIGLAAARENISASTATKRIRMLEDAAGAKFLDRTPRGVEPTPAGEIFLWHAREILGSLGAMRRKVSELTDGVAGELTVVSARSIIGSLLARKLGAFASDYPKVDLAVTEVYNPSIPQEVARGEADLGVYAVAPNLDLSGVVSSPYRNDTVVAVVPHEHPLAARESLTYADLAEHNLLAVGVMSDTFAWAAAKLGTAYRSRYRVTTSSTVLSLVAAGLGVTAVPECELRVEYLDKVAVRELREPWAVRRLAIATRQGQARGPAVQALIDYLFDQPRARLDAVDTD
ncbi:MAG: LysR family transcriptional regulator [Gordonia sp. (in: high G+C Gram-positive bacteria)]|uniref:LysR family transcriptional regulator n=1 Tax=Gordonia sp. (in: high G+C Gram-positive bacteria) TaxID=84139 RepID=UPI0039E5B5C6